MQSLCPQADNSCQLQINSPEPVYETVFCPSCSIPEYSQPGWQSRGDQPRQQNTNGRYNSGALGQAVEPADANKDDDTQTGKVWVSNVNYQAMPTKPPFRSVQLLIRHANSAAEAKTAFKSSKSIYKGVTVPGIGEACYRTKMPPQLNVLKGVNWLIISCGTFKKPEHAGEEKIARAVLPNCPNSCQLGWVGRRRVAPCRAHTQYVAIQTTSTILRL